MVDQSAEKNYNTEQLVEKKNLLSPIEYRFFVKKLPFTNFFVQKANAPGISIGTANVPTPFVNSPDPGDHVVFNELAITFKVDEDLKNWLEIYNWIRGIGVISFREYAALANKPLMSGEGITSDFTLAILTSKRNANYNFNFQDGFPTSVTDLTFDTTNMEVDYLEATVLFRYLKYEVERVR